MTRFTAVRHDGPVLVDELRILWVSSDTPTGPARIMMEGGGYVEVREKVEEVYGILRGGLAFHPESFLLSYAPVTDEGLAELTKAMEASLDEACYGPLPDARTT